MNQTKLLFFIINIYFVIIINTLNVKGKEILIRNNDNTFTSLNEIITNHQNDKELILNFVEDYYDMTELPFTIEFPAL
ncbi:hypothetical protein BCR36DRAFT_586391, partial [Piromyces finnis]